METKITMSSISTNLRSRSEANKLLNNIDCLKNQYYIIIDFNGVVSMSRSFADEFCNIVESLNKEISIINKNKDIDKLLSVVKEGRKKKRTFEIKGETKEYDDIKSLSKFLVQF